MSTPSTAEEFQTVISHDQADVKAPPIPASQTTTTPTRPQPDFYTRFVRTMNEPEMRMLLEMVRLLMIALLVLVAIALKRHENLEDRVTPTRTTTHAFTVTETVSWPTATPSSATDEQLHRHNPIPLAGIRDVLDGDLFYIGNGHVNFISAKPKTMQKEREDFDRLQGGDVEF